MLLLQGMIVSKLLYLMPHFGCTQQKYLNITSNYK